MATPEHLRTGDERALERTFRTGRVSSVDAQKHTARVSFEEDGDLVSFDLQVLVRGPGDYDLPAKDTLVVCIIDPGRVGVGYVLGCLYSDEDAPPLSDKAKRSIAGDDLRLGDPETDKFVALAEYVDDRLGKIQQKFDAHIHTTTATIGPSAATGVISPPTSPLGALQSTAASKVKAK